MPFGIVVSLPCMKRKNGAAGQTTKLVATIAPVIAPQKQPGGYDRYGFRVPCVIVSPRARRNYVSHVVHDHTSILKLIETKWNLPALTYRDSAASNLLDSIDLTGSPAFLEPPKLPAPNQDPKALACTTAPAPPEPV